ncbi:hypothetical protein [Streptomyces sp. NPDC058595]|uniref:hypothetical protein n=1 Tax=Streptomyces sp. NPDC058595 TaxID=3346550 RepID=UPI00365C15DD
MSTGAVPPVRCGHAPDPSGNYCRRDRAARPRPVRPEKAGRGRGRGVGAAPGRPGARRRELLAGAYERELA